MTSPATLAIKPAPQPDGAGAVGTFGEWIKRAARRRAGRFQAALIAFVLLLPLLLTSLTGVR